MSTVTDSTKPTYDYSMIGSMGGEAAQSVNGEMINKIRAGEEKAVISPLDKKLETMEKEAEKLQEIEKQVAGFAEIMKFFELGEKDNVFTQKILDTSGSNAVAFDAEDLSKVEDGTTTVHVKQLALKDIYQSDVISSPDAELDAGADPDESDAITIGIASKPIYQSLAVGGSVTDGDFSISNGTLTIDVTTSSTDYKDLAELINKDDQNDGSIVASYENNRLTIKSKDEKTKLTFTDGDSVLSDLGIKDTESGRKFAAVKTHITYTSDDSLAKTDKVGAGTFSIKTEGKSTIDFETDDDTTWEDLKSMINAHPSYKAEFKADGDKFKLVIEASDSSKTISISEDLDNVTSDYSEDKKLETRTYEELAQEINKDEDLQASVEQVGDDSYRMIIRGKETGTKNALTIVQHNDLETHILDDDDGDGVLDNKVSTAQNLQATINNVDYDLASNSVELSNGIKVTALKKDTGADDVTTLNVSKDTSAVVVAAEQLVEQYNNLYDTIDKELMDPESPISNKDALRKILSDVKAMLFDNYGAKEIDWGSKTDEYGDIVLDHSNVLNNDKNIFQFGFSLEKSGHLKLDKDELTTDLDSKMDDLKALFVGDWQNKGLGTMLQDYLESTQSYQGTFYNYDLELIANKDEVEEEKKDELERLDTKYGIMAEQFSAYSAIIAQMEASFSGLKMMIEQSTKK